MLINLDNFLHLPVMTKSGIKLGKLCDLDIDSETQSIRSYLVRASIFGRSYLIQPAQILDITEDKIVVDDAIIKATTSIKANDAEVKMKPLAEVAMSQEE